MNAFSTPDDLPLLQGGWTEKRFIIKLAGCLYVFTVQMKDENAF